MLENNLKLGDTGNNVKILQEKLKILGFYNAMITGSFGLSTEVGVKAFQRQYNLEETGIVDNRMWQLLFELTETAEDMTRVNSLLSIGSTGEEVRELQTKLKALLYYTGSINGIYDLETENAVKRFQLNNDLTTTGTTNNQTWNLINTLYGNLSDCVTGGVGDTSTTYTVKSGDTLYSIARKYNTTVDELKKLNNLTSNTLSIGQVLKIPTTTDSGDSTYTTYTVKSGDTLYSIAEKYNTTVDDLKRFNNLTSNTLSIGQVLKIPTPTDSGDSTYTTYTVKNGDTLYSIARKYNTTVDEIKRFNNLTSNTLSIGQNLKIPITGGGNGTITYTVKSGDTLYSIARKYNTTVDRIKNLNNLTSNTLRVGQILRI